MTLKTKLVLLLGAVGLVAVVIAVITWVGNESADLEQQLNDRYVESIRVDSVPAGGGRYDDLVVIDGKPRHDCQEQDGWLTCSEDPQPTVEGAQG